MLNPEAARILKEVIGVSDADLPKVGDRTKRIMGMAPALRQYQIVAEVSEAKYCFAQVKTGQRIVFGCLPLALDPKLTDCPLCVRALSPVLEPVVILRELILAGIDLSQLPTRWADCLDPGLERGGLGHVRFKIWVEKKAA